MIKKTLVLLMSLVMLVLSVNITAFAGKINPDPKNDGTNEIYTVVKGDTYGKIAKKNSLTVAQLIAYNPQVKNPSRIYVGDKLIVGKKAVTAPAMVITPKPTATPASPTPTPVPKPSAAPAAMPTPGPSVKPSSVTLTDQAGRQVVINGEPKKIVSCYYISSSALIALGLKDKIVGIEAKASSRPIYSMAAPELIKLPNVGSAKEFNLEGCLALSPDLVILPARLKDSAETITALGIPVLLVNPESHKQLVDMITLLGKATGTEARAKKLTDYYNTELNEAKALADKTQGRPAVYIGGNGSFLSTAPKDMYQASLITAAGGINAAKDITGNNWVDVSYEQILAMNPDVIVIPAEASYSKSDVLNDAQLKLTNAVKNGKVYEMPKSFEAWDSPVPSCTLGIRWLLNALHSDVYSSDSLNKDASAFYKEFYNVTIDTSKITK